MAEKGRNLWEAYYVIVYFLSNYSAVVINTVKLSYCNEHEYY
jgi:hypothetical protein